MFTITQYEMQSLIQTYMLTNLSGEYWSRDMVQLEQAVIASGGGPPPADAYTINGHPGPNYNCSINGKVKPRKGIRIYRCQPLLLFSTSNN